MGSVRKLAGLTARTSNDNAHTQGLTICGLGVLARQTSHADPD